MIPTTAATSELLRRYAVVLERLCAPGYTLAISLVVDTDDPAPPAKPVTRPLAECDIIVGDKDRWDGVLALDVPLDDLHLRARYVFPLQDSLRERRDLAKLWTEALLLSHVEDLEKFSTLIAPGPWAQRAIPNALRPSVALLLWPARLRFTVHASMVARSLSDHLRRLAQEGDTGLLG